MTTVLLLLGCVATDAAVAQRTPERRTRREEAPRGWVGIAFRVMDEASGRPGAAVVDDVYPESPAARAGLAVGDTIVRWNGRADLASAVVRQPVQPGDTLRVRVRREGREQELTVVAAERPRGLAWGLPRAGADVLRMGPGDFPRELRLRMDSLRIHADSMHFHLRSMLRDSLGPRLRMREPGRLPRGAPFAGPDGPIPLAFDLERGLRGVAGAEFTELNAGLAGYFDVARGVLVLRVAPETPASSAGLQAGDVVVAVNGQEVESVRDLRRAVGLARGREVEMTVVRKGQRQELRMRWDP